MVRLPSLVGALAFTTLAAWTSAFPGTAGADECVVGCMKQAKACIKDVWENRRTCWQECRTTPPGPGRGTCARGCVKAPLTERAACRAKSRTCLEECLAAAHTCRDTCKDTARDCFAREREVARECRDTCREQARTDFETCLAGTPEDLGICLEEVGAQQSACLDACAVSQSSALETCGTAFGTCMAGCSHEDEGESNEDGE